MKFLYRMTHIQNIPHILQYGITHRNSPNANPNYVQIGSSDIISRRQEETAITQDGVSFCPGDFIPFYFYVRMPMLYNIEHGYNVPQICADEIIYVVVNLKPIIDESDRVIFFSNGHAVNHSITGFFGRKEIDRIDQILDKEAIKENDWSKDYVIRIRKQAEFFVKEDIPIDYIYGFVCHSEDTKSKLKEMGISLPIIVRPDAYYM